MRISDWSSYVCSSDLASSCAPTFRTIPCCASVRMTMLASQPMTPPTTSVTMILTISIDFAPFDGPDRWPCGSVLVCALPHPNIGSPLGSQCEDSAKGSRPCQVRQIGSAHVCTPVTNAHLVCRLLSVKTHRRHALFERNHNSHNICHTS